MALVWGYSCNSTIYFLLYLEKKRLKTQISHINK
jgi:hypothetical protein